LFFRVVEAWRVMRPRAIAQTHKRVDDLRGDVMHLEVQLQRMAAAMTDLSNRGASMTVQQEEALSSIRQLTSTVQRIESSLGRLDLRESQLRAITRRDIELQDEVGSLASVMCDVDIHAHITRQIKSAALSHFPFPHAVVDNVLPDALYQALIRGLPPVELFNDRSPNERQLAVPFKIAPAYTRRVWTYMARTVVEQILTPALLHTFKPVLNAWMSQNFPALGNDAVDRVPMHASDGRILLRTRGYVIPPHRDPKWGFVTCLLYLARPGDKESWGTQLYTVDDDAEARGTTPHWIDPARCHQVSDVAFVPNRAFVFLNSVGAHGARIPDDEREGLERYAYQFRIGPHAKSSIGELIENLPADRRAFWQGRKTDY
jgi:hypothetical protein